MLPTPEYRKRRRLTAFVTAPGSIPHCDKSNDAYQMRPGSDALKALPFFSGLTAKDLSSLNEVADLARVGPHEVLFRQGDRLQELTILTAGFVADTVDESPGEAFTEVHSPVALIGFASALLGVPTSAGAKTISSSRLIIIPGTPMRRMIQSRPQLGLALLEHSLDTGQRLSKELTQIKLRSAAQRLAKFLLGLVADPETTPARFVLPFEKQFLAAKIGCSQENLSRAFATLRRVGVETERSFVVVGDIVALKAFADARPVQHPAPS
jgi:CRP-like cAMP-binding protein